MTMGALTTAVLVDANILYSRTLRDWLALSYLQQDGWFEVRWGAHFRCPNGSRQDAPVLRGVRVGPAKHLQVPHLRDGIHRGNPDGQGWRDVVSGAVADLHLDAARRQGLRPSQVPAPDSGQGAQVGATALRAAPSVGTCSDCGDHLHYRSDAANMQAWWR
jgi:hypothetical protein